jgi:hypothetical protein
MFVPFGVVTITPPLKEESELPVESAAKSLVYTVAAIALFETNTAKPKAHVRKECRMKKSSGKMIVVEQQAR